MSARALELEPGSFRDPDSRVLLAPDAVLRALSPRGLEDWRALAATDFFARAMEAGNVVATEELDSAAAPAGALRGEVAGALRHERLPFVSYPYEWPFSMLRDAAALQLELLAEALEEGMILKDSSPYNVQWRGAAPVFVDVGSFEPLREGEPWVGYRQFCMLYLYPLMLQAHRGVDFHPWLRGQVEGITPAQAAALLGRDKRRAGVLKHVVLHARLERRYDASSQREVRKDLEEAGFSSQLIKANVRGLRKLLGKLRWEPAGSAWTAYGDTCTYSDEDTAVKERFVREAAEGRRPRLAWDLGCNDGHYARVVAGSAGYVVAVDRDHLTIDRLYRRLRDEGERRILPLVMDLSDPSPGLGWRGRERRPLAERGRPDLVLALALVHHLAITANVPLAEVVDWLASLGATVVVEFPGREDPMVQRLLAGKREETHADYDLAGFERLLTEAFEVEARQELPSGTRVLFRAHPRGAGDGSP